MPVDAAGNPTQDLMGNPIGATTTYVVPKMPNNSQRGDHVLADIAKKRFEDVKRIYRPIENAYIDRVLGFGSEGTIGRLAGQGAITAEEASAPSIGVRPYRAGSGKMLGERVSAALARGAARSGAATSAAGAAEDRALQGKAGLIRFGQGQSSQSTANLGRSATLTASADIARQYAQNQTALGRDTAIGGLAGAGLTLAYLRNRPTANAWGGTAKVGDVIPGSTMPGLTLNMPRAYN